MTHENQPTRAQQENPAGAGDHPGHGKERSAKHTPQQDPQRDPNLDPEAQADAPAADMTAGPASPSSPHQRDIESDHAADVVASGGWIIRCALGGAMMGLANLVPGISGGTMLLACGVYPRFIDSIGDVTTFKLKRTSIITLAAVVVAALAAIVLLAGPVKQLVVDHRWIMYSLFIGLTLGGVPVVWRLIGKPHTATWLGFVAGLAGMIALAIVQAKGAAGTDNQGFAMMLIAGVAGASAMILPGVSGGYLLLVLGVYVPILAAISQFKDALTQRDATVVMQTGTSVILPVGLGVILGVLVVSNLLKFLLHRYEKATLGVLLGLLIGAVAGLWPFQQGVPPKPGDLLKNQTIVLDPHGELTYKQTGKPVEPDDYPPALFTPSPTQIAGSIGLIVLGLAVTTGIDRFGRDRKHSPADQPHSV